MGVIYMILSSVLFVLEIVLQLYTITAYSKTSQTVFIILLALLMGPLVIVNIVSAILVTRTQDFTSKNCGRAICIAFHSFQLGMVWRSLKLLILYDDKDWLEYLNLRLIHSGFQSLPFSIIVTYNMFANSHTEAVYIVCVAISVSSSSLSLTIYRLGTAAYQSGEFETFAKKVSTTGGVILLFASTVLMLLSRCTAISLFTTVRRYWVILPLGSHFIVYLLSGLIRLTCGHKVSFASLVKIVHMSFLNIFDLVGRDYNGVKCSHVLFYGAVLVENIVMSASWMLTSDYGDNFKLMTIIGLLVSFIVGILAKYAGCGYIYDTNAGLMSDAFSNPELNTVLGIDTKHQSNQNNIEIDHDPSSELNNHQNITSMNYQHSPISAVDKSTHSSNSMDSQRNLSVSSGEPKLSRREKTGEVIRLHDSLRNINRSRHGSSASTSKQTKQFDYENQAFEKSQATLAEIQQKYQVTDENGFDNIVQANKNDSQLRYELPRVKTHINDELISSTRRLSRNTHTLGSSQLVYTNGFDDPYRERIKPPTKRKRLTAQERLYYNQSNADITSFKHMLQTSSLYSSDRYPYVSADTSSAISYGNEKYRTWHENKRTLMSRPTNDGYSTDVSNSDYLSFDDTSSSYTDTSDSDFAMTWPPSNTLNLLNNYGISDKVSSEENVLQWLDMVNQDESVSESSFSTAMYNISIPDDVTDLNMSALQKFEIKKKDDRRSFKSFIPTPKGIFFKFRSLNYKGKRKPQLERKFVPQRQTAKNCHSSGELPTASTDVADTHRTHIAIDIRNTKLPQPSNHKHADKKRPCVDDIMQQNSITNDRAIVSLEQYTQFTRANTATPQPGRITPEDVESRNNMGESDMENSSYARSNINERHINAKYRQGSSADNTVYYSNKNINIHDSPAVQYRNANHTEMRRQSSAHDNPVFRNHIDLNALPVVGHNQSPHVSSHNVHTRVQESVV